MSNLEHKVDSSCISNVIVSGSDGITLTSEHGNFFFQYFFAVGHFNIFVFKLIEISGFSRHLRFSASADGKSGHYRNFGKSTTVRLSKKMVRNSDDRFETSTNCLGLHEKQSLSGVQRG